MTEQATEKRVCEMKLAIASKNDFEHFWTVHRQLDVLHYGGDDKEESAAKETIINTLLELGSGGFTRVVMGCQTLIENCCDKKLDHYEFSEKILAAFKAQDELAIALERTSKFERDYEAAMHSVSKLEQNYESAMHNLSLRESEFEALIKFTAYQSLDIRDYAENSDRSRDVFGTLPERVRIAINAKTEELDRE